MTDSPNFRRVMVLRLGCQSMDTTVKLFNALTQLNGCRWIWAREQKIKSVLLHACYDDFAGIGAGFGFPKRFKIIASNKEDFSRNQILLDRTKKDFVNPRLEPVSFKVNSHARYLRIEATKLAERKNDYILALAELRILDENLENLAMGRKVTAQGQY